MDARKQLVWLNDPPCCAVADLGKRPTSGAIDTGKAENMQRQAIFSGKRLPLCLGLYPQLSTLCGRGEGGVLIHPSAIMVAVNPGGGQVSDPFQFWRNCGDFVAKGV